MIRGRLTPHGSPGSGSDLGGVEVLHPWRLVRERLTVFLAARRPEWDPAEVQRRVAKRLLGGPG